MSFLPERRTIGAKTESTPYTAETLAATDYNFKAFNINYSPEIAMMARKVARGDFSREVSIAGKRSCTVSFSVELAYSGTANTAPTYGKLLKACALKETVHTTTGVSYLTDAGYSAVPVTIEVVEKDEGTSPVQVVVRVRGCMGNAKISFDSVGQPCRIDFEFKGALVSIADRAFASILTPTSMNDSTPDAVLSATVSFYTETRRIDKFSVDLGNDVQLFTDPAQSVGLQGAHVVSRNPTVEIDPDLALIATNGDFARWVANTTGAMSVTVGSNFTLSAPAIQIIKDYAPGDREGHVTKTMSFECKRSSGNDEFKILQGAE